MQHEQRRFRCWVFTLNNYSDSEYSALCDGEHIVNAGCTFACFAKQMGSSGTPHIQGYIEFASLKSRSQLATIIPRAWLEQRKGSTQDAINYIEQSDTNVTPPVSYGTQLVGRGKRTDLAKLTEFIHSNKPTIQEIATEFPEKIIQFHKGISFYLNLQYGSRRDKPTVSWFHGPTGTGKSKKCFESAGTQYWKNPANKWWDGYTQQQIVILDDVRGDTMKFNEWLRLLDRYPLQVETKGGSIEFNSPEIIITCHCHPERLFREREDMQQLLRRIDVIEEFLDKIILETL